MAKAPQKDSQKPNDRTLVSNRQATTLICRANYEVMQGIVDFLVDECCVESSCDLPVRPGKAA